MLNWMSVLFDVIYYTVDSKISDAELHLTLSAVLGDSEIHTAELESCCLWHY